MRPSAILCLALMGLASGCAWQRVETAPNYQAEQLPIVIGLVPQQTPAAMGLAPDLVAEWRRIGQFKEVVYPYRENDRVDCVLQLGAILEMEGDGVGAGIASGLTFGLAGTVVGPSTKMRHQISYDISNGTETTPVEKLDISSRAEFGVFANTNEVAQKHATTQIRRIGATMSERLAASREVVLRTCRGYRI